MYYTIIETWNDGYPCDHTDIIFVTSDLVQALKEFSSKRELCSKPSRCDVRFSLYEWTDERNYRVIDECNNYDRESEQANLD